MNVEAVNQYLEMLAAIIELHAKGVEESEARGLLRAASIVRENKIKSSGLSMPPPKYL